MFIYKYVTIITSLLLYAQEINQMWINHKNTNAN